jgi:hypothetical protein
MATISNNTGRFSGIHEGMSDSGYPQEKQAGDPGTKNQGRRSGMKSTEVISASDYPFREIFWPQFNKKRHPDYGNRSFQSLIGRLTILPCREMATISNNTGRFSGIHEGMSDSGYPQEKTVRVTRDPKVREGDPG